MKCKSSIFNGLKVMAAAKADADGRAMTKVPGTNILAR